MTLVIPGVGEATRAALAVHEDGTRPEVHDLADRLALVAAAAHGHQMGVEAIQTNTAANKQLALGVVAMLPGWVGGDGYRGRFVGAESLYAAKVASAEMLWHQLSDVDRPYRRNEHLVPEVPLPIPWKYQPKLPRPGKGDWVPYVPIGARAAERPLRDRALRKLPTTELLLHPAAGADRFDQPIVIAVPDEELNAAVSLGLERLATDYTVDDVQRMTDEATGTFRLTPGLGTDTTAFKTTPRSDFYLYIGNERRAVESRGMHAEPLGEIELTDEVVESFGVLERLARLTAAFAKADRMRLLLVEYDQQRATPGEEIVFTTHTP